MGRTPSITLKIEKKELPLAKSDILQVFKSHVRKNSSGAYIPMSQNYTDNKVFVIVMNEK